MSEAARKSQLERRDGRSPARRGEVDPRDEPSAGWGWHGSFPRGSRIAGLVSAAILVVMVDSNAEGRIASGVSIGIAVLILLGMAFDEVRRRHSWRR